MTSRDPSSDLPHALDVLDNCLNVPQLETRTGLGKTAHGTPGENKLTNTTTTQTNTPHTTKTMNNIKHPPTTTTHNEQQNQHYGRTVSLHYLPGLITAKRKRNTYTNRSSYCH